MFKLSNIRNLLFLFFVIYFSQGILYEQGSGISQVCLLAVILISAIFFIKTLLLREAKPLFYTAWTLLFLLNVIGFVFSADYTNPLHFDMLKNIVVCLLSFYPFYFFAKEGCLKKKHLVVFLFIILPVASLSFYFNRQSLLLDRVTDGDVVNNISYTFVGLLPFVFLITKPRLLAILLFAFISFFIVNGAKRGALIAGGLYFLLFFYYQIKIEDAKNKIWHYLIVFVFLGIIGYYLYNTIMESEFLLYRLTSMVEGDSSGRGSIYINIWDKWYNSESVLNLLFGYGFAASLQLTGGSYAHNDWLELLSNFGIIGIVVYLLLFYSIYRLIMNYNWSWDKRLLLFSIAVVWLFVSMFSMWYTSIGGYTQAILFAYLIRNRDMKFT